MVYRIPASSDVQADWASHATDLFRSTARKLILGTGAIYLMWHILATSSWPTPVSSAVWLITLVLVPAFSLALWLLSRHLMTAVAVWQVGLAAAVAVGMVQFQEPSIGLFYALLPLIGVITLGWPGALVAEATVIGLVWWFSRSPVMPLIPVPTAAAIILGGGATGLLGWLATDTLLTVTQWSLLSSEQARLKTEEARDQQVELKQVQQDLIHANSELARLSERLRAMHYLAEEARRAKEEFVANVSHELRTPLNMIIGFSEMITRSPHVYGSRLPPALLTDVAAIRRNSEHLTRLVNDVLDLSQVEAGRMALSREWISLRDLIGEATLAVGALFQSKGLRLDSEIPEDLPAVYADSTRILQVLLNLLSNAGRFTDEGGVTLKAVERDREILISVSDTGPGISPGDRDKLFEPFQQLDGSIRRRHEGSGLGLSISRRFVEMHGGRMWLETEVGAGTTLFFTLPLEQPATPARDESDARRWFSPDLPYQPRTRRFKAPAPAVPPRYVLMEEDDTLRRVLNRYMGEAEIASVRSIDEAVAELSRSPARALVVNSPECRSADVGFGRFGSLPYSTPVIECWVPGEDEAARYLGVVRYLVKPITRDVLLSTIENLGEIRSILLVDDEPEVLQLLGRMLSSAERHYDVLRARSGRQALALLRDRRPDLMLLDLMMPGLDGFQVLQEKGQDLTIRDIPVAIVSSRDPAGEPITSDTLVVSHSGGLTVHHLIECVRSISEILSPDSQIAGQARPETLAA